MSFKICRIYGQCLAYKIKPFFRPAQTVQTKAYAMICPVVIRRLRNNFPADLHHFGKPVFTEKLKSPLKYGSTIDPHSPSSDIAGLRSAPVSTIGAGDDAHDIAAVTSAAAAIIPSLQQLGLLIREGIKRGRSFIANPRGVGIDCERRGPSQPA